MSLVGQALSMIVSRTLIDRTWAGDRVFEQPIDPINMVLTGDEGQGKPAIAVYTEMVEGEPRGLETQRGAQEITLKIVGYMPPKISVIENTTELKFEHAGAGFVLNMLGRQMDAALHYGVPEWIVLFRGFADHIKTRKSRFLLIELEDGVRIPSIELAYVMSCLPEPEYGCELYGEWLKFDTQLRATGDEETTLADIFKRLIESPSELPNYAQFQMANSLTDAMLTSIGLAPMATDDEGDEVLLEEVDFDVETPVVGPDVPL